jgi:hypothetical protein
MKKYGLITSGTISILIGAALLGKAYYEKLIKKHKLNNDKYTITDNNTTTNEEIIKKSQQEGYSIFIDSVLEYLRDVSNDNPDFEDFMKTQWNSDYLIYIENKDSKNVSTCKRSYKSWIKMYDAVKNGTTDVNEIMTIINFSEN